MFSDVFPDDWILGKGFIGTAVNAVMPNSLIKMLKEAKGLAAGGPFRSGAPIVVGELGPELILPSTGGTVIKASDTKEMMTSGGNDELQKSIKDLIAAISASGVGGGVSTNINAPQTNISSAPTTTIGAQVAPRQRVAVNG
jgi:hypothetical protein